MDVQAQVGLAIQRLRRERELSQDELAHRAGIDQAYLSRIENGQTDIGMRLLVRLAIALNVHPADIITGIEVMGPPAP